MRALSNFLCSSVKERRGQSDFGMSGCVGRNIYIDAGANWCNTLRLHEALPAPQNATLAQHRTQQPSFHASKDWIVFGFEASPIIAPHAQRCAEALSAGLPLPAAPVPATSSSADLYKTGRELNCTMPGKPRMDCISAAIQSQLHSLRRGSARRSPAPEIQARLDSAVRACPTTRSIYTLVPAAVGDRNGTVQLAGSLEQLLKGGLMLPGASFAARMQREGLEEQAVPVFDLMSWVRHSFVTEDFVMLKLDVEGSEQLIVPALAAAGAEMGRLIDVLVWECHVGGRLPCHTLLEMLKASGVGAIYQEPKSWSWARTMCTAPLWRQPSLRRQADAPERSRVCRDRSWWRRSEMRGSG